MHKEGREKMGNELLTQWLQGLKDAMYLIRQKNELIKYYRLYNNDPKSKLCKEWEDIINEIIKELSQQEIA